VANNQFLLNILNMSTHELSAALDQVNLSNSSADPQSPEALQNNSIVDAASPVNLEHQRSAHDQQQFNNNYIVTSSASANNEPPATIISPSDGQDSGVRLSSASLTNGDVSSPISKTGSRPSLIKGDSRPSLAIADSHSRPSLSKADSRPSFSSTGRGSFANLEALVQNQPDPQPQPKEKAAPAPQPNYSKSGARLMDKQWEIVQKKTFTKWVNTQYQKAKKSAITSMADGKLI
jgi:hypothetical protein